MFNIYVFFNIKNLIYIFKIIINKEIYIYLNYKKFIYKLYNIILKHFKL